MVRRWFSITAVLAVAVFMMAVDASQGRERRLGRRLRNRSDANVTPVQSPAYFSPQEGVAVDTVADGRSAFYYDPERRGMSARARPVLLEVRVPADAEIWIEGAKTLQKGTVRQYISPPIELGRDYAYKIEAKWMDNGTERSQTRTVAVRPGERRMVDLTRVVEEKQ